MVDTRPTRDAGARRVRPDASMALLADLMASSLDAGYARAAAARRVSGRPGPSWRTGFRGGLVLGPLLIGMILAVAALQVRRTAPELAQERRELTIRIERTTAEADRLDRELAALRVQVEQLRAAALAGGEGARRLQDLAVAAGTAPVEGPGLRVTVDNAPGVDAAASGDPRQDGAAALGRIQDRDLQRAVNGLWVAGAEAVAVNGQRLTSLSAIRAAGEAILVDNRPLVPPYVIEAIGDPRSMAARFADSKDGQYLRMLQDNYGVRFDSQTRDELRLPAASSLIVRVATGKGTA